MDISKGIKNKNIYLPIIVFVTTLLLMVLLSFILRIVPFGENSFLTTDLKNQYVSYFSYFKSVFAGNDSMFYSFSKTLSGNMVGLFGYYLMSPFNLIFLFFNVSQLPLAITIVSILKIAAISLTMSWYLAIKKVYSIPNLVFSISYAISGYVVSYQQNLMWLDILILLPIVIFSLDLILENKAIYLYTFFLVLSIIVNYYLGIMVCIFAVIYFIASILGQLIDNREPINVYLNKVFHFILGSILAGSISAVVWLPSLASYSNSSKVSFTWDKILTLEPTMKYYDVFSKFIIGSTNSQQIKAGLPNIFVPSIVISLALLFLLNQNIRFGTKVKYFSMITILYGSFYFIGINRIWHGFSDPTWFPYRYSFVLVFILICMAAIQFQHLKIDLRMLFISSFGVILAYYFIYKKNYSFIDVNSILITSLAFLIVTILLFLLTTNKIKYSVIYLAILGISLSEISYNYLVVYKAIETYDTSSYITFVEKNQPIIENIRPDKTEFYRLEVTNNYNENSPFLFNYPGLSHYSSNESDNVKKFLGNLGYRNNGNWSIYANGSTEFADSLLGIRYVITSSERSVFERVADNSGLDIYQNNNFFPIGFGIIQQSEFPTGTFENPFEFQNLISESFFMKNDLYREIPSNNVRLEAINLSKTTKDGGSEYKTIDSNKESYLKIDIYNINENNNINLFFLSETLGRDSVEVYFDGKFYGKVLGTKNNSVLTYEAESDHVELKLKPTEGKMAFKDILLYANNSSDIEQIAKYARDNGVTVESISGNRIVGTLPTLSKDASFVFTLPYDEGWHVEVDGKKVSTYIVADTLLGVEVPKYGKEIVLQFTPKGFILGLTISSISLLVTISYKLLYTRLKTYLNR